jgi:hypothetical protein
MRRHAATIAAVGAGLLLTGCMPVATTFTSTPPSGQATTPAAVTTAQAGSAANPLQFGGQWASKVLAITVTAPEPYTPSPNQFLRRPARCVTITITVTNKSTSQPLNAMAVIVQANAAGAQAESVVDTAANVGSPTSDILPGKSLTWREAFGVPQAAAGTTDFEVQVSSMTDVMGTAYFAGKI